jgi:hypothetical protein
MRRTTIITGMLVAALTSLAVAVPASAVTTSQLVAAEWDCIAPPGITEELHCARPGGLDRLFGGEARTVPMLVFDPTGETFLGTEINVRGDVFHGQRCPKDPPTYRYTYLGDFFPGLDYWACHHFDSDHL